MGMIKIAGKEVGDGAAPFIVAEVGINHNGDLDKALAMIAVAKAAGCDAIKFQTFKAAEFCGDPKQLFTYKSQGREVTESMLAMFTRYEFPPAAWKAIKARCDETGILFLSTPQNRSDLDLLLTLGLAAVKIGSDDFTNLPLIEDYAKEGLPLILSCGMAELSEVKRALAAAGHPKRPVALLVCTSEYPTPPESANLRRLATLRVEFPGLVLGFSDHTQGAAAAAAAVALGASFFEKHFTLDRDLPGPDHWFSENPETFAVWTDSIRRAHAMLGTGRVEPTPAEAKMRVLARRSLVVLKNTAAGETLTAANLGARRPGNGLPPERLAKILGLKAARALKAGDLLKEDDWA